jgi:hypothetical protein
MTHRVCTDWTKYHKYLKRNQLFSFNGVCTKYLFRSLPPTLPLSTPHLTFPLSCSSHIMRSRRGLALCARPGDYASTLPHTPAGAFSFQVPEHQWEASHE